jgi:hypothetical protein
MLQRQRLLSDSDIWVAWSFLEENRKFYDDGGAQCIELSKLPPNTEIQSCMHLKTGRDFLAWKTTCIRLAALLCVSSLVAEQWTFMFIILSLYMEYLKTFVDCALFHIHFLHAIGFKFESTLGPFITAKYLSSQVWCWVIC